MHDPFPIPPIPALSRLVQPYAERFNVPTLALHIHEVLFAALLYTFIQLVVSPWLSMRYAPAQYPRHHRGRKANWDSHVVSMVQSLLINGMALWVMLVDDERRQMTWEERIWGYDGASGLVAAFAMGYFLWDFVMTITFLDIFGVGLLAHATSALAVYSLGFRPFLYYYSTTFILYELSTPLLNVHWFCDKLGLTGSRLQLYNGIALIATFFSCRLIWGTSQSLRVYVDMWQAMRRGPSAAAVAATEGTMAWVRDDAPIPAWLALIYVAANLTLNVLNWVWFGKMIGAVRKRFEPAAQEQAQGKKREGEKEAVDGAAVPTGKETVAEKVEGLRRRAISDIPVPEIQGDLAEMQ